jgi:hypothetical protein
MPVKGQCNAHSLFCPRNVSKSAVMELAGPPERPSQALWTSGDLVNDVGALHKENPAAFSAYTLR